MQSEWTLATLYTHFERLHEEADRRYQERFEAQTKALDAAFLAAEKAVQTALTAAEKAVTKAETAAEKRFDAVNEFRAAYADMISAQMPRQEAETRLHNMDQRLEELRQAITMSQGKSAGVSASWIFLGGAVSLVATIITIVLILSGS